MDFSRTLVALVVALWLAGPEGAAADPRRPVELSLAETMEEDAELTDVFFLDARLGWAVGDRGVVWHTADGGESWQKQRSGVRARLASVWFIDPQHGWIAGGATHPYTHTTSAVLLRTRDGGRHWEPLSTPLPALARVKFFNRDVGWALGEPSALFPSGAFATDDAGRSWAPLPGAAWHGWRAGDFVDPFSGALAGRRGALAAVRRRRVEESRTPSLGLRGLHRMHLAADGHGWLVGDGHLVLTTADLGKSWQLPPGQLPGGLAEHFDWRGLAALGPACWVAGSPGSRILHSPDGGRSWQVFSTGQSLPLNAVAFVDAEHGWAVGALGTVLATRDGGRSWRRQRGGGTRAALAGIYADAADVPWELLARLCAGDGYLGSLAIIGRRDVYLDDPLLARLPQRVEEAAAAAGASRGEVDWRFPLPERGLGLGGEQVVELWNRAHDGDALQRLEGHVVRQLRTWRPDVVFTHPPGRPAGGLASVMHEVVLRAVEKAADPTCYTEQITGAGLEPWRVKKVFSTLAPGEPGNPQLDIGQLVPRLGCTLAEQSAISRALVGSAEPGGLLGFRLASHAVAPGADQGRDFFTGIVLHPGGEARRLLVDPPADSLESLRRKAQKLRNMQALLQRAGEEPQGVSPLAAQVGDLVGDLEGPAAGQLLFRLGQQGHAAGQWELAAETFALLAARFPDHPLTPPALVWLVQYHASAEAAWRVEGQQRVERGAADSSLPAAPEARPELAGLKQAALAISPGGLSDRPAKAVELARLLESLQPALAAEPAIRFPLAAAYRRQGLSREAERFYLNFRLSRPADAWWACADGERWLASPSSESPKPLWHARRAAAKPYLDGRLDDPAWQQAQRVRLASRGGDDALWPAFALAAYDEGFLYLAMECRQAPGGAYEPSDAPRPRDADLSQHDRVDFFLDLDRDAATYYRLTVDHRGWTAESCWGDPTWNPTWFVAAASVDGVWTAEAAIPLEELTGHFPTTRSAWSIGAQRTLPGVGFQSWSAPAAVDSPRPEGFGYLLFD